MIRLSACLFKAPFPKSPALIGHMSQARVGVTHLPFDISPAGVLAATAVLGAWLRVAAI